MELAFVSSLVLILLGANLIATRMVLRDDFSARRQKISQLLFVWFLPIIGSVLVFGVHRRPEKSSGNYPESPDPGDDFGQSGRIGRVGSHVEVDVSD